MSLQRKIDRVLLDLEDIRDGCRYLNEQERIDEAINVLRGLYITSDLEH